MVLHVTLMQASPRSILIAKSIIVITSGGSRGGSEVSTEPPFLAGYVIKLICTVKDPGFMEPPFCLLASYTTIKLDLAYLVSVFERVLVEWQPSDTTEDLEELRY